eukprot:CFRG3716T1
MPEKDKKMPVGSGIAEGTDGVLEEAVDCECESHLEKEVVDTTINCTASRVFELLFEYNSKFMDNFLVNNMKYEAIVEPDWSKDTETGRVTRMVTYTKPLKKNSVGPTEAPVEEKQVILVNEKGSRQVVLTEARTPSLPYGDYFYSQCKFCITSEGERKSRLRITVEVIWDKSTFLKGYITRNTYEGMVTQLSELEKAIHSEVGDVVAAKTTISSVDKPTTEEEVSTGPLPLRVYEWVAQNFTLLVLVMMLLSLWLMITNVTLFQRTTSLHTAMQSWHDNLDPAHTIDQLVKQFKPNTSEDWNELLLLQRNLYSMKHESTAKHVLELQNAVNEMQITLRMILSNSFSMSEKTTLSNEGSLPISHASGEL